MNKIVIQVFSTFFAIGLGQDPCNFYSPLFDRRRSPDHTLVLGQDVLSDNALFEGWYRFTNGLEKMPENCVERQHCGTFVPIWLCGYHPTHPGEITTAIACANTGQGQDCCGNRINNIQVKHCGTFYVYRLRPVPLNMAYCAGRDSSSNTTQAMTRAPTLLGPFPSKYCDNKDTYTDFLFKCRVNYQTDVSWLIDGKSINKTTRVNGCPSEATIHADELQPYIGHTLSCIAHDQRNKSSVLESNSYWMGIKTDPKKLEVHENSGQPIPVKLVSTIPIACDSCRTEPSDCYAEYVLNTTDIKTSVSACNIKLYYSQWNKTTRTAETTMHVVADKDFVNDGDRVVAIGFKPNQNSGANPIFSNYLPKDTQVVTRDAPTPSCCCWGDPHCHTFDKDMNGSKDEYNMYNTGRFIMARTKTDSPYIPSFQVEIQTTKCADNVSCICAVIAKDGNDAIEINHCPIQFHNFTGDIRIISPQHFALNTTMINAVTNHTLISFPSGRSVDVEITGNNIKNVKVYPSPEDANNTEGLCGSFNGLHDQLVHRNGTVEKFNKKPTQFANSWRILFDREIVECTLYIGPNSIAMHSWIPYSFAINENSSIFERGEITHNSSYDRLTRFCTCSSADTLTIDCDNKKHRERLSKIRLPNSQDRTLAIWRSSVAAGPPQRIPYPLYDFERTFVPNEPMWPTPSGLHEADVIKICQDALNKVEGLKKCQAIAKVDFKGIIDMCVEDIKITNDIKLTEAATKVAMGKCKDFVTKYTLSVSANSTQDILQDMLCHGDCSGNGNCTNGTCVCNNGFIGDDCSLDSSKAPFISKMLSGDQCDVNKSPCEAVYFSGSNFYDGSSSSCHLHELNFYNGSFVETGQVFHTDVDYITTTNVGCFLPARIFVNDKSTVAYTFSITNDRTRYSQNKTVIIYDSGCLDCDAKFTCKIKPQSCLIDGNCYTAKEAKPGDSSYTCDPKLNNTHWTNQRNVIVP